MTLPGSSRLAALLLATFVSLPSLCVAATPDFNGDGKADILWRHTSGLLSTWLMNGAGISSTGSPGSAGTDWTIQGTGDFNGDGKTDILWRHSSGALSIWLLNGTSVSTSGSPGNVGTDWEIQATGDFNGDGRTDILWRHTSGVVAIWLIDGTAAIGSGSLATVDANWTVQGTGDFNGDGKADILWRHSSGVLAIWFLNGTSIIGIGSPGSVDLGWVIQGVADFNADGKADILWRHASGTLAIWLMDGPNATSNATFGSVSSSWIIQGLRDFDGDGKADILWRHTAGALSIWFIDGTVLTGIGSPGGAGTDWQIVLARCPIPFGCDILAAHNAVRANGPFGAGNPIPNPPLAPLTWSVGNAAVARAWAANCTPSHNPNLNSFNLGENLAGTVYQAGPQPPPPLPSDSVQLWAGEVDNYGFGPFDAADDQCCGHYTQLVWRRTTSVGCAVQYCTTNSPFPTFPNWYLTVCDYWPPGNFLGQTPY